MLSVVALESETKRLRERLRDYIREELYEKEPFLEELVYALEGGKMIRGTLALFVAKALGGDAEPALPIALALELMHSASLIHDDIIDKSEVRRGRASFWKRYGLEKAIVFPHVMMATAIKYVAKAGTRAVIESMDAWYKAALGQLWDMEILKGVEPGVSYLDVISYKTGAVFEASAVLPIYAIQQEESAVEYARVYGLSLGRAYQILDDLVDVEKGVRDSGSVIQLLKESQGNHLDYAEKKFVGEVDRVFESAARLSSSLAYFARYSLELFLRECSCQARRILEDKLESRWRHWGLPDYQ